MKRLALPILLALISFSTVAKADSIAIGQLSYLGLTPNGSSIFKVSLAPPAGISLMSLGAAIFIGDDKLVFTLPSANEFLFLTGPGTAFSNCPCVDVHFDFIASHGTTVMFQGQTLTLKRRSHSFLRPVSGATVPRPWTVEHYFSFNDSRKRQASVCTEHRRSARAEYMGDGAERSWMILGKSFPRVSRRGPA